MKPYYEDDAVTLYHGDCREVLPLIGDTFDCVVTDPPYSSGGFQETGKAAGSIGTRSGETIALDNLSTRGYDRLMREVSSGTRCRWAWGLPWRNQHELIAYAKRTPAQMMDGKQGNVLQSRRAGNANHPTEKPVALMERLLSNSAASVFLDPFAGSGSTLVAAKQLGRKAIGIEMHEAFCETAVKRLGQDTLFGGVA